MGLLARDWVLIVGGAFAAFTLLVVRPFGDWSTEPPKDLATEWNESIAQLGISPVFPPEEDLYVGDIFAVISGSTKKPLLGRAVRIGHVDLHPDMVDESLAKPVFKDTTELKKTDEYRHQDDTEDASLAGDRHIHLTIAAFPGISISHLAHAGSAVGTSIFGIGAARDSTAVEELRIPVAETYGVAASRAGGRLVAWCSDPQHAVYCTYNFVRHVLAYTIDPDLLRSANGALPPEIELQLVTRVFMTRTIEQRRLQKSARGLSATMHQKAVVPTPPAAEDKSATPESRARDAISAAQQTTASGADAATPAADVSNGDLDEIRLQQTFQRPVVFGFRSWNIQLEPEPSQ